MTPGSPSAGAQRCLIAIRGAVQGVGFRPYVYRLAHSLRLRGYVLNDGEGVRIEVEGETDAVDAFRRRLPNELPPHAAIYSMETSLLKYAELPAFHIVDSRRTGVTGASIVPDMATCDACLGEVFDPNNRRFLYPFTNCTNCGPRYSIVMGTPYDRIRTSMKDFRMCPECQQEYDDPTDRRFHAQPNACPVCGPRVELWDREKKVLARNQDAIVHAATLIKDGKIVALKGLGGFHLICDAANESAVRELRRRKAREEKPFAIMIPSLGDARAYARLSEEEERLLSSPEAPIVLVRRAEGVNAFSEAVSSDNPFLGLMLPSNPLHHILLRELGRPVVATSGNLSDEPICYDEHEAVERLGGIADAFCVHNRPILRHVDDSVVRVLLGHAQVLRRARGYAPLPILTDARLSPCLAVGAHQKNTVATASGDRIVLSQHIGDLGTSESLDTFRRVAHDLPNLHDILPERIACDLHPDYASTQYARTQRIPVVPVQHHLAHVYSCMAEHRLHSPLLGISWDGAGLGTDGTVWGGEFLTVGEDGWERFASLRPFRLPGGDIAAKEPRRSGLALVYELFGEDLLHRRNLFPVSAFGNAELTPILRMISRGVRSPLTTSAGRLFDGVASIIGKRQVVRHEGLAAMELEWLAHASKDTGSYPLPLTEHETARWLDWTEMVQVILDDLHYQVPMKDIARRFHTSLAEGMVRVARAAGFEHIVLTGGCFQNGLLTELAVELLREAGFHPWWHQRIPPNDGGLAVGQAFALSAASGLLHIGDVAGVERGSDVCA